jgi:hypothetical protein
VVSCRAFEVEQHLRRARAIRRERDASVALASGIVALISGSMSSPRGEQRERVVELLVEAEAPRRSHSRVTKRLTGTGTSPGPNMPSCTSTPPGRSRRAQDARPGAEPDASIATSTSTGHFAGSASARTVPVRTNSNRRRLHYERYDYRHAVGA